jgi:hypothetical protein
VKPPQTARQLLLAMSEQDLQDSVLDLAGRLGWMAYHTFDARRSTRGFPDLVLVHPRTGGLIFAELKDTHRQPTDEQRRWLAALGKRHTAVLWRPADWADGRIAALLTIGARREEP